MAADSTRCAVCRLFLALRLRDSASALGSLRLQGAEDEHRRGTARASA